MTRRLAIGIGHPDRGDDAVGRIVAARLREVAPAGVRVAEIDGDAGRLLDLFTGADEVIVVDAALSGAAPGTLTRLDAIAAPLPPAMFAMSTHAMGLADAIELARTLGQLPSRLIVYAIEAEGFGLGAGLSPTVAAAVDGAVEAIARELRSGERA